MGEWKKSSIMQILELIEYGNIPQNEAVRRLEALLQSEINRKDRAADMELVEACEELLWQIGTQGRLAFEDRSKENQAALIQRLKRKQRQSVALQIGVRAIVVVASILVLVIVGDGVLNREWLSGRSTDDGQQYTLQGQSIDPGLVKKSVAAGDDNITTNLTTTDWKTVVAFLGVEPTLPSYLPDGWHIAQYNAVRFDDELILNISYTSEVDPTATLMLIWNHYFSAEAVSLALEQNSDGEQVEMGGIQVYKSSNIEKNRFVWIDGMSVYSLTTTCDTEEVEAIISSFEAQ